MQPRTLECVVKKTGDAATGHIFTVLCHGTLVVATVAKLKEAMKPLIEEGGRIILDFEEVLYVDSMGLGTLVGLKAAAKAAPNTTFELRNLSDRVKELIHFTHLETLLQP